jgi:putative FmdB family regulatory protein
MPIYAYKCGSCGHAKDVLQKLSDAPLTVCPVCGAASFTKQVTAAGFQLKGSGWYATDFRGGSSGAPAPADGAAKNGDAAKPADGAAKPAETPAKPADSGSSPAKSDAPKASAGGCGSGCGCH